jgi:hypothetical protein
MIPEPHRFAGQQRRRRRTPSLIWPWFWKVLLAAVVVYAAVRGWQIWA